MCVCVFSLFCVYCLLSLIFVGVFVVAVVVVIFVLTNAFVTVFTPDHQSFEAYLRSDALCEKA